MKGTPRVPGPCDDEIGELSTLREWYWRLRCHFEGALEDRTALFEKLKESNPSALTLSDEENEKWTRAYHKLNDHLHSEQLIEVKFNVRPTGEIDINS